MQEAVKGSLIVIVDAGKGHRKKATYSERPEWKLEDKGLHKPG